MKKVALVVLCVLALAVCVSAKTIHVPRNYATIQGAIDAANPGDKIMVAKGEWYGATVGKRVEIKGERGAVINDGPLHPGYGLLMGFSLRPGASGTKISDLAFLGDGTPDMIALAIVSMRVDNVTVEHNTLIMCNQGISNWEGSGWKIKQNQILGIWNMEGYGGIGVFLGSYTGELPANENEVGNNKIEADLNEDPYGAAGIGVWSYAENVEAGVRNNKVNCNGVSVKGENGVGLEIMDLSGQGNVVTNNTLEKNDLIECTYPWNLGIDWDMVLANNIFNKNKPQPEPLLAAGRHESLLKPYAPVSGEQLSLNRSRDGGVVALSQNNPNPFSRETAIAFTVPVAGHATLDVFDATGRLVETLVDGDMSAGAYTVSWDRDGVSSGVYFYRLNSNGNSLTKKMVVVR
jgi:hypothetical protein